MPRDGATIFSDLIGKLECCTSLVRNAGGMAAIACPPHSQSWPRCQGHRLARELTAECPKKIAHNMNDPCGAKCPQLPKVL